MMRRESRSFTVEVRRGQKRAPVITTVEQPPSAPPAETSLDDIFRRAEAALFERPKGPDEAPKPSGVASAANAVTDSPSKGRILENLTQVDPLASLLAERAQSSRRGRKPGSKNKPKPAPDHVPMHIAEAFREGRVALTPQLVNDALRAMAKVETPPRPPAPAATTAERPTSAPASASMGSDRGDEAPQQGIAAEAPSKRTRTASRVRRSATRAELKPGERWKRRLRGLR